MVCQEELRRFRTENPTRARREKAGGVGGVHPFPAKARVQGRFIGGVIVIPHIREPFCWSSHISGNWVKYNQTTYRDHVLDLEQFFYVPMSLELCVARVFSSCAYERTPSLPLTITVVDHRYPRQTGGEGEKRKGENREKRNAG